MDKNYPEITRNISANLRKLRTDIPDVMKGFSALAQAAGRDGALYKEDQGTDCTCTGRGRALRWLHQLSYRSARQARRDASDISAQLITIVGAVDFLTGKHGDVPEFWPGSFEGER